MAVFYGRGISPAGHIHTGSVLSILLVLLPLIQFRMKDHPTLNLDLSLDRNLFLTLAYFAFLGTGFMFIVLSFIQKMILPLENPSYAAAVVLASVLISSGIGSLLSQHLKIFQKPAIILLLSLSVLAYSLFLPIVINEISPYSLKTKILSFFFILMPAGILMGTPFPLGLSFLGRTRPKLIPGAGSKRLFLCPCADPLCSDVRYIGWI